MDSGTQAQRRTWWSTAGAVVVLAAGLIAILQGTPIWMADFAVYDAAGVAAREGRSLYDLSIDTAAFDNMQFTYPPFAALVFVPLALLGTSVAHALSVLVNCAALAGVLCLSRDVDGGRTTLRLWMLAVACLLTPVLASTTLGQLNVVLMLLILLDFSRLLPQRLQGIATGIALGIKLWPAIFVVFLFCIGRSAVGGRALAAGIVTVGLGFAFLPADSREYWLEGAFLDTNRVADLSDVQNQSLPGLIARASAGDIGFAAWLPLSMVVAVLGLAAATWAYRRREVLLSVTVVAFTALLASPVSWPHHAVWIVPALVWLFGARWRGVLLPRLIRIAAVAWFLVPTFVLAVPEAWRDEPLDLTQQLVVVATGYTVVTVLALAALPFWLPRLSGQDEGRKDQHDVEHQHEHDSR